MTERGAVPDNGIAVEPREAQRPTSLAARTPIAAIPGNGDIAVGVLAGREVRPAGRVSLPYEGGDPPWRLPALHPLVEGERKTGNDAPASLRTGAAERWLLLRRLFEN
jgi:hypothetical protein